MAHPCMRSLAAASLCPADSSNLVFHSAAHGRSESPATFPRHSARRVAFPRPSIPSRSASAKQREPRVLGSSQRPLGHNPRCFGAESPSWAPAETTPELSSQSENPRARLGREGVQESGDPGAQPHGEPTRRTELQETSSKQRGSSSEEEAGGSAPQALLAGTADSTNGSASQVSLGGTADSTSPGSFPGKASGSGLLWSPTTGGVQSATSSHGLPDEAVAVRNLVAQSKQAHLATVMSRMHHRRSGYPFASMVDFANDASGHPILSLSSLAIHARNLLADPRCTLVVQIPGWSGLADARVTIFGDVYPVPSEHQDWAKRIFATRHRQEASEQWGNRYFFRMNTIRDIYFVGGFGTVAWIDAKEYVSVQPDRIASEDAESTLQILNSTVAGRLKDALATLVKDGASPVNSVAFISVDGKGVDIRVTQGEQSHVQRLSFPCPYAVETVEEAKAALDDMLSMGALPSGLVSHQM